MKYPYKPIPDVNSAVFRAGRRAVKILAAIRSYFYTDCPLCGVEFAGFEWNVEDAGKCTGIPVGKSIHHQTAICPWCYDSGRGCERTSQIIGHRCGH